MRLSVLAVLLCVVSFAQTSTSVSDNQPLSPTQKKAALTQILNGMGISPTAARTTSSVMTGKLTLVGEYPYEGAIKIETQGIRKTRSEFDSPNGPVVRISNNGNATIIAPNTKPKRITASNSLFEGVRHIPALSLLASAANGDADLMDAGDSKTFVVAPAAAQTNSKDLKSIQDKLGRSFEVDPSTGAVTKLSFLSYSEDGVTKIQTTIVYSDYRIVSGVAVPFKQQTYVDGVLRTELQIQDVQFNTAIPATDFDLAEVN